LLENHTVGGNHVLAAALIPMQKSVPKYKSWSYLCRNEVALETGGKLFYTDSKGERGWALIRILKAVGHLGWASEICLGGKHGTLPSYLTAMVNRDFSSQRMQEAEAQCTCPGRGACNQISAPQDPQHAIKSAVGFLQVSVTSNSTPLISLLFIYTPPPSPQFLN